MALRHASAEVNLALDLLAGPAGGLNGAFAVLSGCASFPDKGGDPVIAEVVGKLTVGERVSKVTVMRG